MTKAMTLARECRARRAPAVGSPAVTRAAILGVILEATLGATPEAEVPWGAVTHFPVRAAARAEGPPEDNLMAVDGMPKLIQSYCN